MHLNRSKGCLLSKSPFTVLKTLVVLLRFWFSAFTLKMLFKCEKIIFHTFYILLSRRSHCDLFWIVRSVFVYQWSSNVISNHHHFLFFQVNMRGILHHLAPNYRTFNTVLSCFFTRSLRRKPRPKNPSQMPFCQVLSISSDHFQSIERPLFAAPEKLKLHYGNIYLRPWEVQEICSVSVSKMESWTRQLAI